MQREDWDRRYAAVENLWATRPNRFLVREVEELPPGRALDLACGEGQNAIWLATLGWDVTGVDYSEVAILKGTSPVRVLTRHALPNALPPTIQVVGLNLLYLAGGIVMVETVFTYPGVGRALVDSITARDIPVMQFIVVLLAVFYVCVNIIADVLVLVATPRRRFPR